MCYNTLMILAVVLATLLLVFMIFRRHVGVPFLAMVAGITVYDLYGAQFARILSEWVPNISESIAQHVLYLVFVAFFPLVLYFRVGKSGLFGVLRFIEVNLFHPVISGKTANRVYKMEELQLCIFGSIRGKR